jgi:hypothetical protein
MATLPHISRLFATADAAVLPSTALPLEVFGLIALSAMTYAFLWLAFACPLDASTGKGISLMAPTSTHSRCCYASDPIGIRLNGWRSGSERSVFAVVTATEPFFKQDVEANE